jgi:hypothetical protein
MPGVQDALAGVAVDAEHAGQLAVKALITRKAKTSQGVRSL